MKYPGLRSLDGRRGDGGCDAQFVTANVDLPVDEVSAASEGVSTEGVGQHDVVLAVVDEDEPAFALAEVVGVEGAVGEADGADATVGVDG